MPFDPASRYALVDTAFMSPAYDILTRSMKGPFVDTGVDLNFTELRSSGRIYLSVETIRELADGCGLLGSSEDTKDRVQKAFGFGLQEGAQNLRENYDYAADLLVRVGDLADRLRAPQLVVVPQDFDGAGDDVPVLFVTDHRARDEDLGAGEPSNGLPGRLDFAVDDAPVDN